jgi:hypothetical protein
MNLKVLVGAFISSMTAFLLCGLLCGFVLVIFIANAGGAWDNAKKYVEEGNHSGKGSDVHKATVVGDTVGDTFKDTSYPSLNILIKFNEYGFYRCGKIDSSVEFMLEQRAKTKDRCKGLKDFAPVFLCSVI